MATNLAISDQLISAAQKVGGHKTKRDAVTKALEEYIQHKKQLKILDIFGQVEYDPRFNYKKQRKQH